MVMPKLDACWRGRTQVASGKTIELCRDSGYKGLWGKRAAAVC